MNTDKVEILRHLRARVSESIEIKSRLLEALGDQEVQVALALVAAYQRGNKLVLFGNGGSAADAQHIAAEFVGRYYLDRAPLPALALGANISSLTGIGNDYDYAQVFARQIEALGVPGDVAMGLTTSGNSRNVIEALRAAKRKGMTAVALTGEQGGLVAAEPAVDVCIRVPSSDTPRVQEAHTLLCHSWSELVEAALFGPVPA